MKRMMPLSGVDAAFLHLETPATPMHVASLHLFDLPARYRGDFFEHVKNRIGRRMAQVPVFRRRLATMPFNFANPVWVDDEAVDLDYHFRRIELPPPGNLAQFEDCVGALHSEPLDRQHPLWMIYVIEGLASGQRGYYLKVHHAVLDGESGAALASAMFDLEPQPRYVATAPAPVRGGKGPGALALAAAALRHDAGQYVKLVRHLPDVMSVLAGMIRNSPSAAKQKPAEKSEFSFGPRTPFNVSITGERGIATLSLPLADIKAIGVAFEATVNDVILALCAGTLRRYLARHGGVPRRPLVATMPISLRETGDHEVTTKATLSLVSLATHLADPVKRLLAICAATASTKSTVKKAKSVIPTDFPGIGVPWLISSLASAYGRLGIADHIPPLANVAISNVLGPKVPLYAAGARMASYWPLSIVEHGVGINITVMSYAGAMGFGFTVARNAVPEASELSECLADAHKELLGLLARAKKATPHRKIASRKK